MTLQCFTCQYLYKPDMIIELSLRNLRSWQCLKIMFIQLDEFTYLIATSPYILNLEYRSHDFEYKNLYMYYTP